MIEIFVVLVASILLVLAKGDVHCGRVIVSGAWLYCPFCGDHLQSDAETKRYGRQVKAKPLAKLKGKSPKKGTKQEPIVIAGKTHFLDVDPKDLQMAMHLKTPCPHVASRGKPKGKQCRLSREHDGRHRY